MALPNWWQVATPHRDITSGNFNEAVFAADLGDVVMGKAPLEYTDPATFFSRTYLTKGLRNLLEHVLTRLSGGSGAPVVQLQTPFGGGKTHSLVTLYHIVKNREKIRHLDIVSQLPKPKNAKVVVFVGTQADALKGKTPWGEIAAQLGVYEKVREHDEKRLSPGKEILSQMLGKDPVLILIDELAEYSVKAKDFMEQVSAFSQEISEAVRTKNNACLICTLPSSAPYGELGEKALDELQRIFGRVETIYTPVEGIEIYEVIRKRLFDSTGDEKEIKKVAQAYFEMYQKPGTDVPSEIKEVSYRDRIEKAYPFHPEIIDVLYEHWGSFPTFQRTRGVLRLLAEIVKDLYKTQIPSPLIQSSLVNLGNQSIRRELVKHIGNEYDSVISADIAGANAIAPKIDKEMGSEYEKFKIASGIATTVFLYSFRGAGRNEITLPRIRVALLREGIPSVIVGDSIGKLEERLWYFHSEKKQYSFRNKPNLNRVILQREETINKENVLEELKSHIQKNAGKAFEIYLWPDNSSDIPDNKKLKLIILAPDFSFEIVKDGKFVSEILERSGSSFRIYKNTLFILAMDDHKRISLLDDLRRFMAIYSVQKDEAFFKTLSKESQDELKNKLKATEKELPFKIVSAYRHLAFIKEGGQVEWKDLGIPTIGMNTTLSDRVMQYLKDQERILSAFIPKYIIEKAFVAEEVQKQLSEIYDFFLKTPGMPALEKEDVLYDAVRKGIKNGLIGCRDAIGLYYKQDASLTMDSIIIRGEIAQKEKEKECEASNSLVSEGPSPSLSPIALSSVSPEISTQKKVKQLSMRAKIPWDKLSEIVRGVITPLNNEGATLEITIEIMAKTENEFNRTTLDSKVRETLSQIGALIEKMEEQ